MSKFCPNCGNRLEENQLFCANCGARVAAENNNNNNTTVNNYNTNNYNTNNNVLVPNRNIAISIILSIVTCGIYGLYWFIKITDESKAVSNGTNANGLLAVIYTILTCGIYSIYWSYKMGQNMHAAGKLHNKDISDNAVLYLILSIFGLGVVNYCLIQNDLNKFSN